MQGAISSHKETLVYADIGPLSLKQKSQATGALQLDDDRVQYAEVTQCKQPAPLKSCITIAGTLISIND